jgi:hypothetical protein
MTVFASMAQTVVPFIFGIIMTVSGVSELDASGDFLVFNTYNNCGGYTASSTAGMTFAVYDRNFKRFPEAHSLVRKYLTTHEKGHALQYIEDPQAYWYMVAIPSFLSSFLSKTQHSELPWERGANRLAGNTMDSHTVHMQAINLVRQGR